MKFYILIDDKRLNNCNQTLFARNQKYECGELLKVKVHILFYGDNS
jgi:hypothetical protein